MKLTDEEVLILNKDHGCSSDAVRAIEAAVLERLTKAQADTKVDVEPVARVAEVHMSRYTVEWTNGPLPEGMLLYPASALAALQQENENLRTVMMAAAVEITEHWDAHCDSEGLRCWQTKRLGLRGYGIRDKEVEMTDLTKDENIALAREAKLAPTSYEPNEFFMESINRFATLCRADLVAKVLRLEAFVAAAFEAHPNLDLDVERVLGEMK